MKYYLTHHRTDAGNIICIGADLGDSSHEVATFPASQAVAAIICCQALNNEDLANGAANADFSQEYGSDEEPACNTTECENCKGEVTDGQSFCSQQCCDANLHDLLYQQATELVDEQQVEPLVHNCMQCGTLIGQGADYCTSDCAEADGAQPTMVTLLERAFGSNVTDRSIAASASLDAMSRRWAA